MMSIAGTIVFGVICEMLLPDSGIKKYVRIVLGMLLVFTVAQPLATFYNVSAPELGLPVQKEQAYAAHSEMDEQQKKQIMQIYADNLKKKIKASCGDEETVNKVAVRISEEEESFGEIQSIAVGISVRDEAKNDGKKELKKQLAQDFGVSEKDIRIEITSDKGEM